MTNYSLTANCTETTNADQTHQTTDLLIFGQRWTNEDLHQIPRLFEHMDVDDEEWAELTEQQKQAMIDEYARDEINSDIGWRVEE